MNELYQICSYHLQKLLQNKNELSLIKGNALIFNYQQFDTKLKHLQKHLVKGKYNLSELVNLCKIGSVINLDLLSELLINIRYHDYVKGLDNEELLNYYKEEADRITSVINEFVIINFMFDNLIHFLKHNYNYELNGIISDKYYRLKLSVIRNKLLNNDSYFNSNLNSNEAFSYINNNLLLEEDLLSRIVDDYNFSNVLINEWTLLKDRLLVIKDMLFDIDDDIEIKLYKDFVNDLIKFIDNRIVKLQPKFIEKVMVKRFKGE